MHKGLVGNFECSFCMSVFLDREDFIAHREEHLKSDKPYVCLLCDKTFPIKKALVTHRRSHGYAKPKEAEDIAIIIAQAEVDRYRRLSAKAKA